jgi:hypothetical protein
MLATARLIVSVFFITVHACSPLLADVLNQGVAPFYQDWRLELAAISADGKIQQRWPVDWKLTGQLPGDADRNWKASLPLPEASVTGLTLARRVIHPLANGKPLRFASAEQERHAPGWLSLDVLP